MLLAVVTAVRADGRAEAASRLNVVALCLAGATEMAGPHGSLSRVTKLSRALLARALVGELGRVVWRSAGASTWG